MIEKMKNTQGPLQRTRAIKIVLFCHGQGVSWSYETGDSAECSETFQQAVPSSRGPVTRPLASPSGKLKKSAHSSSNFKIFKWQTATPTIFIFRTLFEPFGQPFHSQKRSALRTAGVQMFSLHSSGAKPASARRSCRSRVPTGRAPWYPQAQPRRSKRTSSPPWCETWPKCPRSFGSGRVNVCFQEGGSQLPTRVLG